jgi:acetyl/propionyl-CoA carboxylase alpha subunit
MELNARLQVEHPVTELVTGIDIVREQVRIAAGRPLALVGRAPRSGHAIEVRLNAEDPARGFAPSPGRVERFRPPLGPGVRLDTHVEEGCVVPPHYDSLLAKLVVWDGDRHHAIERALRALGELVLEGPATTRAVAMEILASEEFRSGEYDTGYLARAGDRLPALSAA